MAQLGRWASYYQARLAWDRSIGFFMEKFYGEQIEYIKFTVGILICRWFRNFLKECQFLGINIVFLESTGILERDFIIRGNHDDISKISKIIKDFED